MNLQLRNIKVADSLIKEKNRISLFYCLSCVFFESLQCKFVSWVSYSAVDEEWMFKSLNAQNIGSVQHTENLMLISYKPTTCIDFAKQQHVFQT